MAPKRAVAGSGPKIGTSGKFEGEFQTQKNAPYIQHRLDVWERLYAKHQETVAKQPQNPIKVELPDGKVIDGKSFKTTPLEIAKGISKGLADSVVVAKVLYSEPVASLKQCVVADVEDSEDEDATNEAAVLWDLTRPLEGSCRLELLKFDNPQAKDVFWHSSAHILGQAMERVYGCHLTIGPALDQGFYYDGFFGSKKIGNDDYALINAEAAAIAKEKQEYLRCVITKEEALELFSENPFKVQLITNKVPDGALTSCYRCGPLIDLCRGPHIPNTEKAKSFKILRNSAAYWLGNQQLDSLQRVYGIAFPSDGEMKEYIKFREEAEKNDHRNVGRQQELFFHHPTASPGCTFWFPAGARIYNKLIEFIRGEYRLRGFDEVITPNMYSSSLFKTSGHYQNYKDDMYTLEIEKQEWQLKPMNCPGHFLMFDHRVRSYKELPLRYADFGVLHRNEATGALSGLTRVRRFQQDDAHIFARPDQIKSEVVRALDFLTYVYGVFGFKSYFALSTRPKKALGSKEIWDNAEAQLRDALNEFGKEWELNPGDGAFYGPKIDIRLMDVMNRKHQCGTIQLDFNGPIRFNLQYRKEGAEEAAETDDKGGSLSGIPDEKNAEGEVIWKEGKLKHGFERPVVIHRAILGSVERQSAILMEHYKGKWPFWLSPRQVKIVPVSEKCFQYAAYVEREFVKRGFCTEADLSSKTLSKKVREAQVAGFNYTCVVGEKEATDFALNVRKSGVEKPLGDFGLAEFLCMLDKESVPTSEALNEFGDFNGRKPQAAASDVKNQGASPASEADFEHHPYVKGFMPSKADAELFEQMREAPKTPNMKRWYEHVGSYTKAERALWQ